MSLGSDDSGVQLKEPVAPLKPLAMVETVWRLVETPFFKMRETGPVAFAQVMSRALPVDTPTKSPGVLVIFAACAKAKAEAATRMDENCMLMTEGIDERELLIYSTKKRLII